MQVRIHYQAPRVNLWVGQFDCACPDQPIVMGANDKKQLIISFILTVSFFQNANIPADLLNGTVAALTV